MNHDLLIVLALLAVNLAAAVVYLILHLRRGLRKKGLIVFFFLLVFPVVGPLFMLLAELLNYLLHRRKVRRLAMEDLSFNKERMKLNIDADMDKELDQVPIEEALLISDKGNKRRVFIDLLKSDDYAENMHQIGGAVENEDMEVAHYAASFYTDALARYKARENELRDKVNKDPTAENVRDYVDYMEKILAGHVFGSIEAGLYLERLDNAAALLYQLDPDMLRDSTITVLVDLWSELKRQEKIEPWVARAQVRCRSSLDCFKVCARYYYAVGDRDRFFGMHRDAKRSGIVLDHEALEWIRYFS